MSRTTFLPFALPDIDQSEIDLVVDALKSGWITTGPKVKQFEAEFAATVGAKHAIALNSCTAAMHLGLEAVGVGRGDEVITTPYTFAASAEVIRYFDATPVLVDICPSDFNIDPGLIEAAVTPRTKAIIPVHIAGAAADLDAIYQIAARHRLAVIEDAAHAFPMTYKRRMVGQTINPSDGFRVPHIVAFSFYATKTLTTAEGGMITTDDDALAERCRIMGLHGISKDAWKRYTAEGSWYYEIIAPGFKYNMTDVAAAMGLAQLHKANTMTARRTEIAHQYNAAFAVHHALQTPADAAFGSHAWHLYMLRLNTDRLAIDRATFIEQLKVHHIGSSVHFIPLHIHPYYRENYGYKAGDFPVAYGEYSREISLPIYSKMSDRDVDDVIAAVLAIATTHQI